MTKEFLTYPLFENLPGIRHASFLRQATDVDQLILRELSPKRTVWAKQCHGSGIVDITSDTASGELGDALVTSEPGVALMVYHADCQAALFCDPVKRVIAAAHSGWRGSVQNIYAKVIAHMVSRYGCHADNIRVGIGPSLGPKHAEFIHYRTELPEMFWQFQPTPTYFDFWEISRHQLQQAGIQGHHIHLAEMCTYANVQDCFSYRRDKTTERQHKSVIVLSA